MGRRALALALALLSASTAAVSAGPFGNQETLPPSVPVGYSVAAAGAAPAPTSLAFASDGRSLFVSAFTGQVLRYPVVSPAGLPTAVGAPEVFADGFTQPLGVLATEHGVFVADKESNERTNRQDGLVWRLRDLDGDGVAAGAGERERFVTGLPNGRHNTNGMALGPGGALYIANGNSTDSGFGTEGGDPEIQPWSGSLLAVDPARSAPYECEWVRPGGGSWTVTGDCGGITVAGTGWRNIYDVAFAPAGHAALDPTGTGRIAAVPNNGPDGFTYHGVLRPRGEDSLSILDVGPDAVEHFGFPWCLHDRANGGLAGFAQDPGEGACRPLPAAAFTGLPPGAGMQADPTALFGMHVSANGLAFDEATGDLFVAEWGSLWNLDDGETPTGHKVVRVTFSAAGAHVEDFLTGVVPIDLVFAPDGSMWVADMAGPIYRVDRLPLP